MISTIHPAQHPGQAEALQGRDSSASRALASDPATTRADDSGQGSILFVGFVTAVLLITGAVAFLSLFTTWWALGLVFGVDLLVTSIVGTAVFTILSTGKLRRDGQDRAQRALVPTPRSPAESSAKSDHASPVAA